MARVVNIIRNPVGGYGFAGSVPIGLAFDIGYCNDKLLAKIESAIIQCGPGFARRIANRNNVKMRSRSFDTMADAVAFARNYRATSGLEFDINGVE